MRLKLSTIAVLGSTLALTVGCPDKDDDTGGGADGGGTDGGGDDVDEDCTNGVDDDGDSDVDCDDSDCADEVTCWADNPYSNYSGWESLDYYYGPTAGSYNCQYVWNLSGSPVTPMPLACENCEFLFDVTYTVDAEFTTDDGTCAAELDWVADPSGRYGYSPDFSGYGGAWVYGYGGTYAWFGYGEFSGTAGTSSEFKYTFGYTDSDLGDGNYYTYYQYGAIDVE